MLRERRMEWDEWRGWLAEGGRERERQREEEDRNSCVGNLRLYSEPHS